MSANDLHYGVWARLDFVEQRKQTAALVWLREHHVVFHKSELKVLYTDRAAKYGYSTEFRHDIDPSIWGTLTKKQRYPQYEAKKWLMHHHVIYHPDDFGMLFTERAIKYGMIPKKPKTEYGDIDVHVWESLTKEQRCAERHAYQWLLDHHVPFHILDYFTLYSERAAQFGRAKHKRKHALPTSKRRRFVIKPASLVSLDVAEPDLWLDGFE